MKKTHIFSFLIAVAFITFLGSSLVAVAGDDEVKQEVDLSPVAGSGLIDASGDAKFRQKGDRKKFDVSVEARAGLTIGEKLTVKVDGTEVGKFKVVALLDPDEGGDLDADSNPAEGDAPLDLATFPDPCCDGNNVEVGRDNGTTFTLLFEGTFPE
ncbi:MAG: hypothetical protein ACE5FZ_08695 [Nitrospiria bacterium]